MRYTIFLQHISTRYISGGERSQDPGTSLTLGLTLDYPQTRSTRITQHRGLGRDTQHILARSVSIHLKVIKNDLL